MAVDRTLKILLTALTMLALVASGALVRDVGAVNLGRFAIFDSTLANAVGVTSNRLDVNASSTGTNNGAAATTTQLSALIGIVCASAPTLTDGRGVNLCVNTSGAAVVTAQEIGKPTFTFRSASGANQDSTNLSAGATILYAMTCSNSHATNDAWVLVYDVASPTSASTIKKPMFLPARGGARYPTGVDGDAFSTRLSLRAVGTKAAGSTTAVANDDVLCSGTLSTA